MKKPLALILIVALAVPAIALADIDLSGMTFDELVTLREQLNLAIWNSQEWQEVTVPAGVWEIGKDIPAGHWTVRPVDGVFMTFWYGDQLNSAKTDKADRWNYDTGAYLILSSKKKKDGSWKDDDEQHEIDIDMKEGFYIVINAAVIFTPFTGKPDLGFK